MADAQTIQALGGIDMQLRKLVALQESSNQGPTAESGRGQFVGTGPGGSTVGDPGQAQRKQMMQAQLMEFSPNGLKQLQGALKGALGADKPTDHLAQARKWGWIKKILGWAGLLSTIYFIWANWDNLKAFFQNLWPNLKKGWNYMRDKATEYWKKYWPAVKKGFNDAWAAVVGFVTPLWNDTIWPGLTSAWDWVVDTITPWAAEAWKLIQQGWDWAVKTITPWAVKAWDLILEGWGWVVKKFTAWWEENIKPFVKRIGTIINTYWEAIKEFVTTWVYAKVWLKILWGWEWVMASFSALSDYVFSSLRNIWLSTKLHIKLAGLKFAQDLRVSFAKIGFWFDELFRSALFGVVEAMLGPVASAALWLLEDDEKAKKAKEARKQRALDAAYRPGLAARMLTGFQLEEAEKNIFTQKMLNDKLTFERHKARGEFLKKNMQDMRKGDKALDKFKEATEGVTDILFENSKNMREASNNTKKAAEAMKWAAAGLKGFKSHWEYFNGLQPAGYAAPPVIPGVNPETGLPYGQQQSSSAIGVDPATGLPFELALKGIDPVTGLAIGATDPKDIDRDGVQTGILNRIANSIENMRPSTPFIGPMPAPAGSSPGAPSQVFTNRQLAT